MHWSTLSFEAHNSLSKGKKLYVSSSARQSDASKKTGCIVVDDHNYPQKVSVINSAHDNNQSHHVSCSCVLSTPPYTNRPFIANTTKYIPVYKMKWCRCCQQNRSSATVPLAPLPSLAFAIFFSYNINLLIVMTFIESFDKIEGWHLTDSALTPRASFTKMIRVWYLQRYKSYWR